MARKLYKATKHRSPASRGFKRGYEKRWKVKEYQRRRNAEKEVRERR